MKQTNIILIGMPGSGKSTLGVLLAKELGYDFVDTDLEIQHREGQLLQDIVDQRGSDTLRQIESEVCQSLSGKDQVISTGGSVVYSPEGMAALKKMGEIYWLDVSFPEIEKRIQNFSTRGLAKKPGQTLEDLFNERMPLYKTYAETTVACDGLSPQQIVDQILTHIHSTD